MSVSDLRKHTRIRNQDNKIANAKCRLRLWMIFMVLFIGWGTYTYLNQLSMMKKLLSDLSIWESEKNKVEHEHNELMQKIERLRNPEHISQLARGQGMVYPGERLIQKQDK